MTLMNNYLKPFLNNAISRPDCSSELDLYLWFPSWHLQGYQYILLENNIFAVLSPPNWPSSVPYFICYICSITQTRNLEFNLDISFFFYVPHQYISKTFSVNLCQSLLHYSLKCPLYQSMLPLFIPNTLFYTISSLILCPNTLASNFL